MKGEATSPAATVPFGSNLCAEPLDAQMAAETPVVGGQRAAWDRSLPEFQWLPRKMPILFR